MISLTLNAIASGNKKPVGKIIHNNIVVHEGVHHSDIGHVPLELLDHSVGFFALLLLLAEFFLFAWCCVLRGLSFTIHQCAHEALVDAIRADLRHIDAKQRLPLFFFITQWLVD